MGPTASEEPLKHSTPKRELLSVPLKPVVPTVAPMLQLTSSCSGQKPQVSFETLLPHTPRWILHLPTWSLKYIQKWFLTTPPVIILVQITFKSYLEGYNCPLTSSSALTFVFSHFSHIATRAVVPLTLRLQHVTLMLKISKGFTSHSVQRQGVAGKTLHGLLLPPAFLISLPIVFLSANCAQPHWWLLFWRPEVLSASGHLHMLFWSPRKFFS